MARFLPSALGRSTAISSSFRTLSWDNIFSSLISRSAVMGKPSFSLCIRIFFIAKMLPVTRWRALWTSPKVPSPSFCIISYSPILEQPLKRRCMPCCGVAFDEDAIAPGGVGVACDYRGLLSLMDADARESAADELQRPGWY